MADRFNPQEMQSYGLDPMNMEDCAQWFVAEPEDPNKPIDYSGDPFEFGGKPRQADIATTGSTVKAEGTCPTLDRCPVLKCVQKFAPVGACDAAVELAAEIIGANRCMGNGYSQETATGAICRAPEKGLDETGRDVANIVSQAFSADQPPA